MGTRAPFILMGKDRRIVCSTSLSMERDPRVPAQAVAKRISSLANGDIFRPVGREDDAARCNQVRLGFAAGIAELPVVDGAGAAGSAEKAVRREP